MSVLRSIALFLLAAVAEIGGALLVWQGVREQRGLLFVGAGVVPMIPGGFLTFATTPLYGIYELAPRVGGFDAGVDQQLAGVLMKIGNVPLLWPAIGVLFARWAKESGASGSETTLASANHSV